MKRLLIKVFLIILVFISIVSFIPSKIEINDEKVVPASKSNKTSITSIQCDYQERPLGIDNATPLLSWQYSSGEQGFMQQSYRISIASSEKLIKEGKPDILETDIIVSRENSYTFKGNPKLRSFQRYYWTVEAWDNKNKKCLHSMVSWFETAIYHPAEWSAKWITDNNTKDYQPAPLFRRSFNITKKVVNSRIYITGMGYYTLYINGNKIGKQVLDPAFTDYSQRILYTVHDITNQLVKGENIVAVELGNGLYNVQPESYGKNAPWSNRPRMLSQINIVYEDNSRELIVSDDLWRTSTGALISDNLSTGELYDARLLKIGWNTKGYDDSGWKNAAETVSPAPKLQTQAMPLIEQIDRIVPITMRAIDNDTFLFDMGRNIAGVCKLRVKGSKGTMITLRYGEVLDHAGRLDQSNINISLNPGDVTETIQTDRYILSGNGMEEYTPSFTYHGFQYVQVETSSPVTLTKESLIGITINSNVKSIGKFSCSNPLINKIWNASNNSYLANLQGYPTDCPQREKTGWMADGCFVMESGILNYESAKIYEKWVTDMSDERDPNGNISCTIPSVFSDCVDWTGPIWASAIFDVPYTLYQYTGNIKPINAVYSKCKQYLAFIEKNKEKDGLVNYGVGDWLTYKAQSSVELMVSCYYYMYQVRMYQMACLTQNYNDTTQYLKKANEIKERINTKYLNYSKASYDNETQLSYALPLYVGIVPQELRNKVAANLAKKISENNFSLDFGLVGCKVVPIVLSDYGYNEVAYKMISNDKMPSWGYWINNFGATTLYEAWDKLHDIKMAGSLNHPSMGSINAWFYKSLAGINLDPQNPYFRHIIIKPSFTNDLNWVKASYNSIQGIISSEWKREGESITLSVVIPANTTSTIYTGSGKAMMKGEDENKSVKVSKDDENLKVYSVPSGKYTFFISLK